MRTATFFMLSMMLAAGATWILLRTDLPMPEEAAVDSAPSAESRLRVLAGHRSTFSLGTALAEGTAIDVDWAWPEGANWSDQWELALSAHAQQASAVISLRGAASGDALYAAARAIDISIVEIDATMAEDLRTLALRVPEGSDSSFAPAAPLSLGNAIKMAEIIARDFGRLDAPSLPIIETNLRRVKERLFRIRTEAEIGLSATERTDVILLAPVFAAFVRDLGLPTREVGDLEARVALAAFAPPPWEAAAFEQSGVRVVLLDSMGTAPASSDDYFAALEGNVTELVRALSDR